MKKHNKFDDDDDEDIDDTRDLVTITLTENDAKTIHNLMSKLLKSNKIEIQEFSEECKYCGKPITMRNVGFGWKPMSKDNQIHRCKEGTKHFKKLKEAE